MERCERSVISIPGSNHGRLEYTDYECRPFPLSVKDKCDDENRLFCAVWSSARYFTELGIGFAAMALVALLIGVSTHSRRRRVWRAVAGLVILHGKFFFNALSTMKHHRHNRVPQLCFNLSRLSSLPSYTERIGSRLLNTQSLVSLYCPFCLFGSS